MAKKIKLVPLTKKDLAKATPAQRKLLKGAAKLVIAKAKKARAALAPKPLKKPSAKELEEFAKKRKGVTLTDIAVAGTSQAVKEFNRRNAEAAAAWTDADEELKKEAAKKTRKPAHLTFASSDLPVESDKPGVARNPKPPKVVKPLAADGALVPPEIISYHFLKLMERMAAEHGGTSAQALEDLKADIAKRKST